MNQKRIRTRLKQKKELPEEGPKAGIKKKLARTIFWRPTALKASMPLKRRGSWKEKRFWPFQMEKR